MDYDYIFGSFEVSGYYIAICFKEDYVDFCTVSPEKFGSTQTTFPIINLTNTENKFITDIEKMKKELQIDPSLGRPIFFYQNNKSLGISRIYVDKKLLTDNLHISIEIIGDDGKKIEQTIPYRP